MHENTREQTPHDALLSERARALFPKLASDMLGALRADRVVQIRFYGPAPNDHVFKTAPRAPFAARHSFMRERPQKGAGQLQGWLLASDDAGAGVWVPIAAGQSFASG